VQGSLPKAAVEAVVEAAGGLINGHADEPATEHSSPGNRCLTRYPVIV
jgi:hypothetical protein